MKDLVEEISLEQSVYCTISSLSWGLTYSYKCPKFYRSNLVISNSGKIQARNTVIQISNIEDGTADKYVNEQISVISNKCHF